MIAYLINQILCLPAWNLINVKIDAYKFSKNKTVAHGINGAAYILFSCLLCYLQRYNLQNWIVFLIASFCNRQLTFDIPLNLRRKLKWNYVSLAKPPRAIMDRIEIRLFGYNGTAPIFFYSLFWIICLIIKFFI